LRLTFSAFFSAGPVILRESYVATFNKRKILIIALILGVFFNLLGGLFLLRNFYMRDFLYAMGLFNKP
jgi:hypothetical protein